MDVELLLLLCISIVIVFYVVGHERGYVEGTKDARYRFEKYGRP